MNRDDVAAMDADSSQRIGEAVRRVDHLREGVARGVAFVVFVEQRNLVAKLGVPIEAVDHYVVVGRHVPLVLRAKLRERLRPAHRMFLESNHGQNLALVRMLRFVARGLFLQR